MTPLYTWIDVDRVLSLRHSAGEWPKSLVRASAYHDALAVELDSEAHRAIVEDALALWFGGRFDRARGAVLLEALPEQERLLPVLFETAVGTALDIPWRPDFRRVALLPDAPTVAWPDRLPQTTPPIVAFYSFKGGVGRTLHLLACAKAIGERRESSKVLLVDADLEAPGITTLARRDGLQPTISLADLLALAHGDTGGGQAAIELVAHHLRAQPLAAASSAALYVLPAFRDDAQSLQLDIRPEHLTQGPGAAWCIVELLGALGRAVEATAVLIDLRAGLTELASPVLFDARARRVIVTTLSQQSVEGTRLVVKQLAKLAPPAARDDLSDPTVLVSQVPRDLVDTPLVGNVREDLQRLYPEIQEEDSTAPLRLQIEESHFAQELLVVRSLADAFEKLDGTSVAKRMRALVDQWDSDGGLEAETQRKLTASNRTSLEEFAKKLEFAESGEGQGFLATAPLHALAQKFLAELPIAVVIGAKGSGKTYTYLQLARQHLWSGFLSEVLKKKVEKVGHIWPLLHAKSLKQAASRSIQDCAKTTAKALGVRGKLWLRTDTERAINVGLRRKHEALWWRDAWLRIIAKSLGVDCGNGDPADAICEQLRRKQRKVVVIVDGLEEIFLKVWEDERHQVALRGLLQDVPARLNEIPSCPLGVVVFVRADIVRSAIPQNTRQFESLHEAYSLRWDFEQALRLATWVCDQAKVPLTLGGKRIEQLTIDECKTALFPVWGRKLGSNISREARSHVWVIAALSDFKGQIQARDMVRLLRHAADLSRDEPVTERLLSPKGLRDALRPCSAEKIAEIEQEISDLKRLFEKLRKAKVRKVPFDAVDVLKDRKDILFLVESGVLVEDQGEYYMPEIFRHGLGFQLDRGARPRVLNLFRRVTRLF